MTWKSIRSFASIYAYFKWCLMRSEPTKILFSSILSIQSTKCWLINIYYTWLRTFNPLYMTSIENALQQWMIFKKVNTLFLYLSTLSFVCLWIVSFILSIQINNPWITYIIRNITTINALVKGNKKVKGETTMCLCCSPAKRPHVCRAYHTLQVLIKSEKVSCAVPAILCSRSGCTGETLHSLVFVYSFYPFLQLH